MSDLAEKDAIRELMAEYCFRLDNDRFADMAALFTSDVRYNAGFSTVTPWLSLASDFMHENVVNLDADAESILNLYRELIKLRKQMPALTSGDYVPLAAEGDVLLYRRVSGDGSIVIALNLGAEPVSLTSTSIEPGSEILLSTFLDRQRESVDGELDLRGNEGVIVAIS